MKVLHICSDFAKQSIYNNMVTALNRLNVEQIVYVPVRSAEEIGQYMNNALQNTTYLYSHILKKYHRLLFKLKISTIYNDVRQKVDLQGVGIVHAHFLFSDGAVALLLKKKHQIEYVVAVRNTDINFFFRYMKHLYPLAMEILREAKQVIFITPGYRDKLLEKILSPRMSAGIRPKCIVIPNGVDEFWLNNIPDARQQTGDTLRLLYVGDFSKNKNVPGIIRAAGLLAGSGQATHLTIIGGGGDGEQEVIALAASRKEQVTVLPRTREKKVLIEQYRAADIFVMPSFYETFGLVYIEAMSQGLPIIYTKGQGIDGYFPEGHVGLHVNPADPSDIAAKVMDVWRQAPDLSKNAVKEAATFNWQTIVSQYHNIYSS